MQNWYYARGSEKKGPVDSKELRRMAASGELLKTDLLWKQGMKEWVQAGKSLDLFPKSMPIESPSISQPPPLPHLGTIIGESWASAGLSKKHGVAIAVSLLALLALSNWFRRTSGPIGAGTHIRERGESQSGAFANQEATVQAKLEELGRDLLSRHVTYVSGDNHSPTGEYRKMEIRVARINAYSLDRTSSLVVPYTGAITMTLASRSCNGPLKYGAFATSQDAVSSTAWGEWSERTIKQNYKWQDGNWSPDMTRTQWPVLPTADSPRYKYTVLEGY